MMMKIRNTEQDIELTEVKIGNYYFNVVFFFFFSKMENISRGYLKQIFDFGKMW